MKRTDCGYAVRNDARQGGKDEDEHGGIADKKDDLCSPLLRKGALEPVEYPAEQCDRTDRAEYGQQFGQIAESRAEQGGKRVPVIERKVAVYHGKYLIGEGAAEQFALLLRERSEIFFQFFRIQTAEQIFHASQKFLPLPSRLRIRSRGNKREGEEEQQDDQRRGGAEYRFPAFHTNSRKLPMSETIVRMTGTETEKMTTFPAKISLSAMLFEPKSSTTPAANSTR